MFLIVLSEFFAGLNIQTLDRILSDHNLTGMIHTTVNELLTILRLRVSDMWFLISNHCNCGLYKRLGLALITAFTRLLLLVKQCLFLIPVDHFKHIVRLAYSTAFLRPHFH